MSTALYRRYRPETFAEVIGQEHVTEPLLAALAKNRVSHAYLFSGPRGCGKTTSARILARCLNCVGGPTPEPCGSCESCVALARGGAGSLDVIEIDAASHRGIDDAREIRDRAAFAPASSRFKIFIIDEAHMVTKEGFNALLKIVEEPPEHVKFVFATTEPDKVIGTIRSRTHHYPFRLVPPGTLQGYLASLCEQEGVPVGKGVLPLVVRAGAGSVRDSLSVLDQLMAGAGDEGLTYPLAVSLLGYTDSALLDSAVEALAAGDGATVFQVVDRVVESGHDPRRYVEDLLERLRDLLVVAAVPDGAHAVLRGVPADQLERMRVQAQSFGRAELSRAADVTNSALTEMTGATSPRLQLELLCARLLLPGADHAERGLHARLDRLEKRIGMAVPGQAGGAAAPAPAPVPDAGSAPRPAVGSAGVRSGSATAGGPVAGAAPSGSAGAGTEPERTEPERTEPAGTPSADTAAASRDRGGWDRDGRTRTGSGPAAPGPAAPGPAASGPAAGGAAGAVSTETVRSMWTEVLGVLSGLRRTTWTLVSQHAQVLHCDAQRLVLGFASPGLAGNFGRGAHPEYLRQALVEVLGLDCRIEAVVGDQVPARPGSAAPSAQPGSGGAASRPGVAGPSGQQGPAGSAGTRPGTAAGQGWGEPAGQPHPGHPPNAPAGRGPGGPTSADPGPQGRRPAGPSGGIPEAPGRPEGRGNLRSEPGNGRAGAGAGAGAGHRGTPDAVVPRPEDDIPLPDEPPDEDPGWEEDPGWTPRRPAPGAGQGPSRPGPAADAGPASRPGLTPSRSGHGPSRPGPGNGSSSAPGQRTSAAGGPTLTARAVATGAAGPTVATGSAAPVVVTGASSPAVSPAAPPPRVISLAEDVPSRDDADLEGSSLVGAAVVEQLLGGRVIEERSE